MGNETGKPLYVVDLGHFTDNIRYKDQAMFHPNDPYFMSTAIIIPSQQGVLLWLLSIESTILRRCDKEYGANPLHRS